MTEVNGLRKFIYRIVSLMVVIFLISTMPAIDAEAKKKSKKTSSIKSPYEIMVNREACTVTVYERTPELVPVRAFACSPGMYSRTPLGENFKTSQYYEWHTMVDNSKAQYVVRFNGHIMFHSVPYFSGKHNNLEKEEFNKLGQKASLGCIRLSVGDAKWIHDNCTMGTKVTVYDDISNPGPLGKPDTIKMNLNDSRSCWDPTDPSEDNPWNRDKVIVATRSPKGHILVKRGFDTAELVNKLDIRDYEGKIVNADDIRLDVQGIYNRYSPAGEYKLYIKAWYKKTGLYTDSEIILKVV